MAKAVSLSAFRILSGVIAGATLAVSAPANAKKEEAPYNYGPPPEWQHFKQLAENAIRARLVDPDSAKFEWPNGYKQTAFKPFLEPRVYGYATCGLVNSRNRMGGYVGRTFFAVVIDYDHVVYAAIGDSSGFDFTNETCTKSVFPPPPGGIAYTDAGPEIVPGGTPPHAGVLGASFSAIPLGAVVDSVEAGSPAEKAGLKPASVVVKVNGISIKGATPELVKQIMGGIGDSATFELYSGETVKVAKP